MAAYGLEDELLDPMIDRVFHIAMTAGLLPEPPQELQEQESELKVEYISILAQAQKAVAINSMERTATFLGGLSQIQAASGEPPGVLDKFNFDEAISEFGDSIGISPRLLRDDKEVEAMRDAKAKQAEQMAQMAQAQQAAEMAKTAGSVKTDERNMAADVMGQVMGTDNAPDVGQ